MEPHQIEWVFEGTLARASRPFHGRDSTPQGVDDWISKVKQMGIRSIICFLSESELREHYHSVGIDLLGRYHQNDLETIHIPVRAHSKQPLETAHLLRLLVAVRKVRRPLLIHCNAGAKRTGTAVNLIQGSPQIRRRLGMPE